MDEFCYTGYLSLGFHPWEKREGWWLTQIVGQSFPGNGWGGGGLYLSHVLKGDFYVNVTRVWDWPGANVGEPVDGSLDLLNSTDNYTADTNREWRKPGLRIASYNATRRTDQDIVANGFDYQCCEEVVEGEIISAHCKSYNILHQACSIGGGLPITNNSYDQRRSIADQIVLCPGAKKANSASHRLAPGLALGLFALIFVVILH
jgi:hypothetical protein